MWDTPPVRKRKITCFARGGTWGARGASGSRSASSARSRDRNPGRRIDPPTSDRITSRRLQPRSSDIDELAQAEQDAREALPRLPLSHPRARRDQVSEG